MASKMESSGPMCELHSYHRGEMNAPRHPKSTQRFSRVSLAWENNRKERVGGKVSQLLERSFTGASFRLACLVSARALLINWTRDGVKIFNDAKGERKLTERLGHSSFRLMASYANWI